MRYVRLLIPLVLLSIAAPAFAACGFCGGADNNTCHPFPGLMSRCRYEHYLCYSVCVEEPAPGCTPRLTAHSFGSEFRIPSVTVEDAKTSPVRHESTAIPPKKLKKT
jgi:hypothetical protein